MRPELIEQIRYHGMEHLGCHRGSDGECYYIAGLTGVPTDYGKFQIYEAYAFRQRGTDLHRAVELHLSISDLALNLEYVQQLIAADRSYLKHLALGHVKVLLDGPIDPEMKRWMKLVRESPPEAFSIPRSGSPIAAQKRLRAEIVVALAELEALGHAAVERPILLERLCADLEPIDRALRMLNREASITGGVDGPFALTDEGHLEAESAEQELARASASSAAAATLVVQPSPRRSDVKVELGSTFSRRTLLLGAGFSRNWGGRLAREVWQDVFGSPRVKARPSVTALLRTVPSFEAAIDRVRNDPAFVPEDLAALQGAVADAFVRMDRQFRDPNPPVATPTINDFIGQFCPGPVGIGTGYVFTLNQDMLLERIYGTIPTRQTLSIPGITWSSPPPGFPAGDRDIPMATVLDPRSGGLTPSLGNGFHLIKLHGSMNWRDVDNSASMVIGGGKPGLIAKSPLLSWYHDIFRAVLCAGDVRLMVIGYGWGDEHINAVIAEAAKSHGLQIYIWDMADPLQTLPDVAYGPVILDALMGSATRSMSEVMPAYMNPRTVEYERIVSEFF